MPLCYTCTKRPSDHTNVSSGYPPFPLPREIPSVSFRTTQYIATHASASLDEDHVLFHDRNGQFRGRIALTQAQSLWRRYSQQQKGRANFEHFCDRMCCRTFPLHYEGTATSYQDGTHQIKLKNQWSVPSEIYTVLHDMLGPAGEKFASPLNVHPLSSTYCTAHKDDAAYGATFDAYSAPWKGAQLINPEYEEEALFRATKWAISSALHDDTTPCYFVLVVPAWNDKKYHRLLRHSVNAILLQRTCENTFNFTRANYAYTPKATRRAPPGAKFPVEFWAVFNTPGWETYSQAVHDKADDLRLAILNSCKPNTIGSSVIHLSKAAHFYHSQSAIMDKHIGRIVPHPTLMRKPMPTIFRKDIRKTFADLTALTTAYNHHLNQFCSGTTPDDDPEPQAWPSADVLKFAARTRAFPDSERVFYTDGSVIPNGEQAGSGIYCSDGTLSGSYLFHGEQTINRAELAPAHHVLYNTPVNENITIASDSLCSIFQIRNTLRRENRIWFHRHEKLIRAIVNRLVERHEAGATTRIVKVKAHADVYGNEQADKHAKAAT